MPQDIKTALFNEFSRTTRALSHPKRLQIIDLLGQGEKTVESISKCVNMEIKNTSAQLRLLLSAQLVGFRKDGKNVFYFLSDPDVIELWHTIRSFGEKRFEEIQRLAQYTLSGPHELEEINHKTLISKAKQGKLILLDVRPSEEYASGHIPFAISIPLDEIAKRLKELPKGKEIVAYCRGPYCFMARSAVEILRKKGFKAFQLRDGIHEFKK